MFPKCMYANDTRNICALRMKNALNGITLICKKPSVPDL